MPLKVIVVDDATFVRDMVKRTLRNLVPGVELFEAPDGARAASMIKSKKPDLILSDWEMPNMSGDELLRWVREQPEFVATPFIMITSRGDRNHVMKAVEAGVNDYISKPFTSEELTRKITKQLKRIGHDTGHARAKGDRGTAFGSIDVLTGGKPPITTTEPAKGQNAGSKPKAPKPPAARSTPNFDGKVYLRFPHATWECEMKEVSLQAMCVTLPRPDVIPTVFDQASVDLIDADGQALARLNAYVHSIAAAEAHPDAASIRIITRFIDQDPAKLDVLSKIMQP